MECDYPAICNDEWLLWKAIGENERRIESLQFENKLLANQREVVKARAVNNELPT